MVLLETIYWRKEVKVGMKHWPSARDSLKINRVRFSEWFSSRYHHCSGQLVVCEGTQTTPFWGWGQNARRLLNQILFIFIRFFEVQLQHFSKQKRRVPSQSCQTEQVYCGGVRKKLITAMLCYPLGFHTELAREVQLMGKMMGGRWRRLQRGDDNG